MKNKRLNKIVSGIVALTLIGSFASMPNEGVSALVLDETLSENVDEFSDKVVYDRVNSLIADFFSAFINSKNTETLEPLLIKTNENDTMETLLGYKADSWYVVAVPTYSHIPLSVNEDAFNQCAIFKDGSNEIILMSGKALGLDSPEDTITFNDKEYKNALGSNAEKYNLEYLYECMRTYSKDKLVFYNTCDVMAVPSLFLGSNENWNSIEIHNAGYHGYAAYCYDMASYDDNSYVNVSELTDLQNYDYIKGNVTFYNHDTETIYVDHTSDSPNYEIDNMLKNVAPGNTDWVKTQDVTVSNLGIDGVSSETVIDNIKYLMRGLPLQVVYDKPFEKTVALYNDLGMVFKLGNYYCVYSERIDALSIIPDKYLSDIEFIPAANLSSVTAEEIISCLNEFEINNIRHIYDYTGIMSDDTVYTHNRFYSHILSRM